MDLVIAVVEGADAVDAVGLVTAAAEAAVVVLPVEAVEALERVVLPILRVRRSRSEHVPCLYSRSHNMLHAVSSLLKYMQIYGSTMELTESFSKGYINKLARVRISKR